MYPSRSAVLSLVLAHASNKHAANSLSREDDESDLLQRGVPFGSSRRSEMATMVLIST